MHNQKHAKPSIDNKQQLIDLSSTTTECDKYWYLRQNPDYHQNISSQELMASIVRAPAAAGGGEGTEVVARAVRSSGERTNKTRKTVPRHQPLDATTIIPTLSPPTLKFTLGILFTPFDSYQCMSGASIDYFVNAGRYIILDLPMVAEIDLHKLVPDSVYTAWMKQYNKPNCSDVEFSVCQPTSSRKDDSTLMAVQEPSSSVGVGSKMIGFSRNLNSSYSQRLTSVQLLKIIEFCKTKTPQVYLRFMTTNDSSTRVPAVKRSSSTAFPLSVLSEEGKCISPKSHLRFTRAGSKYEGGSIT